MPHSVRTYSRSEILTGAARVVFAGLIWGLIPVFVRMSDGSTVVKIWIRVLTASLAMVLYLAMRSRLGDIRRLGRTKILEVIGQGAILAVNWMFFLHAIDGEGSVALAELLGYTSPVIVATLAPFVLKERFDARVFLPISLAIVGFTVMLAPGGFSLEGEAGIRALWGLCSAFTIATLNLRGKKIIQGVPGEVFLLLEHGTVLVLLAPLAIASMLRGGAPGDAASWLALIGGLGLLCTVIAGLIHLEGFRRIRVDHSAILCYTEPVSAILYTAALPVAAGVVPTLARALPEHPEPLGTWTLIGGALVVAAGVTIIKFETKPEIEPLAPIEFGPVSLIEEDEQQ